MTFLVFARGLTPLIARGQGPVATQFEDASASIVANVGEGLDDDSLGDKRRFFRYAKRSAGECEKLLPGAAALRLITQAQVQEGHRLLRDIKWDLNRLIQWSRHT